MGHRAAHRPDVVDRVLDDVEPRRFLVEPAREDPPEGLGAGIADVDLDEGAGQLLHLPGRGRLAGAQPHDDVAGANRLARVQREFAHLAVALVEQPQHRDALRHRRGAGRKLGDGLRNVDGLDFLRILLVLLLGALRRAGGEGKSSREGRDRAAARSCSVGHPGLIVAARRRAPAAALERARTADRRRRCRSGSASAGFRNFGAGGSDSVGHVVDLAGQPGIPFGRHPADVVRSGVDHPAAAVLPPSK